MSFEETELRLGLPGNGRSLSGSCEGDHMITMARKRGFHETTTTTTTAEETTITMAAHLRLNNLISSSKLQLPSSYDKPPPPNKAQAVGWPPIRSYRKNSLALQKGSKDQDQFDQSNEDHENNNGKINNNNNNNNSGGGCCSFVKVSLDGAPYLRKVDLNIFNTYKQLSHALSKLFRPFTLGNCGSQAAGMKDFMNESKLIDLLNGSDYVSTYEDKDGDWMLVGDVPWQMFVESCKRLRIMKGKEAIGLAPRTVEKCKNYKS